MNPIEPRTWKEYVGQKETVRLLQFAVWASVLESRPLPNILICGSDGLGKSTLARLTLQAAGQKTALTDAAILNTAPPMAGTLGVDEIHNLKAEIADSLNVAMDKGDLHLVGATTNPGALPLAFRSRFRIFYLEPYSCNEIATILRRICARQAITVELKGINSIARRARFNPRQAINYLLTLLDISKVTGKRLTKNFIEEEMSRLGIDEHGYTKLDRTYLSTFNSRPVGINYLSSRLGLNSDTIESEIEPYLLRTGVIERTPKGRIKLKSI